MNLSNNKKQAGIYKLGYPQPWLVIFNRGAMVRLSPCTRKKRQTLMPESGVPLILAMRNKGRLSGEQGTHTMRQLRPQDGSARIPIRFLHICRPNGCGHDNGSRGN